MRRIINTGLIISFLFGVQCHAQMLTSEIAQSSLNETNSETHTINKDTTGIDDSMLYESIVSSQLTKINDVYYLLKKKNIEPLSVGENYMVYNNSLIEIQSYLLSYLNGAELDNYGLKGTDNKIADVINHAGRINGYIIQNKKGYNFSSPSLVDKTSLSYLINVKKIDDHIQGSIEYMPLGYKEILQQIISHPALAKQMDMQSFIKQDNIINFAMNTSQTLLVQLPDKNNSSRFLLLTTIR